MRTSGMGRAAMPSCFSYRCGGVLGPARGATSRPTPNPLQRRDPSTCQPSICRTGRSPRAARPAGSRVRCERAAVIGGIGRPVADAVVAARVGVLGGVVLRGLAERDQPAPERTPAAIAMHRDHDAVEPRPERVVHRGARRAWSAHAPATPGTIVALAARATQAARERERLVVHRLDQPSKALGGHVLGKDTRSGSSGRTGVANSYKSTRSVEDHHALIRQELQRLDEVPGGELLLDLHESSSCAPADRHRRILAAILHEREPALRLERAAHSLAITAAGSRRARDRRRPSARHRSTRRASRSWAWPRGSRVLHAIGAHAERGAHLGLEIGGDHVHHALREPQREVAGPRADIGDDIARLEAGTIEHLLGLLAHLALGAIERRNLPR